MPGNLVQSEPNGVMPASLCTAFTELREYAQLQNQYHDGTIQRSQLAQTSRRTFRLSKRLSASLLSALYSFWASQNGGLINAVRVLQSVRRGGGPADRQQLRSHGKRNARPRDGGVPWQLGAGDGYRTDEHAGVGVGGGWVRPTLCVKSLAEYDLTL